MKKEGGGGNRKEMDGECLPFENEPDQKGAEGKRAAKNRGTNTGDRENVGRHKATSRQTQAKREEGNPN